MRPIDERTVLVTGATSGLGRQLVQRLAGAVRALGAPRPGSLRRPYQVLADVVRSAATRA